MNDITKVTISDLRALGRQGGATAKLVNGAIVSLGPSFGTCQRQARLAEGKMVMVDVVERYADIIKTIRTVQRNGVLIARQEGQGKHKTLRLTGKGYHR